MSKPKLKKRRDPAFYRGLFEASPEALFAAEQDGTIIEANHAASMLFACERTCLLDANIRDFYTSLNDYKRFREAIEREECVHDFATAFRTHTGHRFEGLVTASVRQATDSTCIGYQGVIRKISTRHHLERHVQKLRTLAAKLLIDIEKERVSLGADLHDSIGQILVLSKVKVDLLRHADIAKRKAVLNILERNLDEMDHLIRSLTFDTSSPVLYSMGFVPGLQALSDYLHAQHRLTVRVEAEDTWDIHNHDIRGLVYRSVRELLMNVVRHADTDQATVSLRRDTAQLQVVVEDAGTGFDVEPLNRMDPTRHFGLFSIRERLLHIGGYLTIESAPGTGTHCLITLPSSLAEAEES